MAGRNWDQPISVAESQFKIVDFGQDAEILNIRKRNKLDIQYFKVGEVVAVLRSDKRMKIAQVVHIYSEYMTIALGEGLEKKVPATDVPVHVSKLIGPYIIRGTLNLVPYMGVEPFLLNASDLTSGQSTISPSVLGGSCRLMEFYSGLSSDCYYDNEPISVVSDDGSRRTGLISSIGSDGVVKVDIGNDDMKLYSASEAASRFGKFLYPRYLIRNPSTGLSLPTIKLGASTFRPLILGESCMSIARTKHFPNAASFYKGEPVAVRMADGQRICMEVSSDPKVSNVNCESGPLSLLTANRTLHNIPCEEVPDVCKLEGKFYLVDDPTVVRVSCEGRTWRLGRTSVSPLRIGQVSNPCIFYKNNTELGSSDKSVGRTLACWRR